MNNNIICNACGKKIIFENEIPREDFVTVNKNWGYFSKKDGKTYRYNICEDCVDRYVASFVKPVEIIDTTELL